MNLDILNFVLWLRNFLIICKLCLECVFESKLNVVYFFILWILILMLFDKSKFIVLFNSLNLFFLFSFL